MSTPAGQPTGLAPLILIVDDEPGICEASEMLLNDLGYRTLVASSGRDAVRKASVHRPDLILLDITMPDLDGFATCRALRADRNTADIPVIFVTARSEPMHKVTAFDLGACDYVTKPFDQAELSARIRAHLTSRTRTRRELEEAEQARRTLYEELLQAGKMAALGQLLSSVAHELNNPLMSVLGYAQLLLSRAERTQNAEMLDDCQKLLASAERATRVVRNLLTFSRKREPERRPVAINDVVAAVLELESHDLQLAQVSLERQLAEGLPPLLGDEQQLQQVVLNLITNARQAIEATGRGHGRVVVRTELVSLPGEPPRIRLSVTDDGPGVSPEHLPRIFEPFFTTKPEGQGTGLGLSLCRDVVRVHGGRIWAESTPGQGARFIVELPAGA
ncbi:MAG TPA: ATP-binding protein [Thermodesulfobacteriota bacterium]|nr:ATP-binding protein [Thermodesulfobacteriota bacterium]